MWWGRKSLFRNPIFTDEELQKGKDEALASRAASGYSTGQKVEVLLPFVILEETRRLNASTNKLLCVTVFLFLATLALLWVTIVLLGHTH